MNKEINDECENLIKLAVELEENIKYLENKMRDVPSMVWSKDSSSEDVQVLLDLKEQWKMVAEQLEEANRKDTLELQQATKDYEQAKKHFDELEKQREEFEKILVQRNLIEPNIFDQSNENTSGLEISESIERNTFLTTNIPQEAAHSTPDVSGLNGSNLEDTMQELQST